MKCVAFDNFISVDNNITKKYGSGRIEIETAIYRRKTIELAGTSRIYE